MRNRERIRSNGNTYQASFNSFLVSVGAGDGLEHNGVGQDSTQEDTSDVGRNLDVVEVVHGLQNGTGAANRPDPHFEGTGSSDVAQLVVVDYGNELALVQIVDGLRNVLKSLNMYFTTEKPRMCRQKVDIEAKFFSISMSTNGI